MPNVLHGLGGMPALAMARIRRTLTSATLLVAAATMLLVSGGLAVAALYIWLATFWPAYLAALVTACAPLLLASALIVRVMATGQWASTQAPSPSSNISDNAEQVGAAAAREMLSELKANPASMLTGALVLGIVAGLLGPSSRD